MDKKPQLSRIFATEGGLISESLVLSPGRWFMPPGLVNTACVGYNTWFAGANIEKVQGAAIGFSETESVGSTVGEFCERYCSAMPPVQDNAILASYAELLAMGKQALLPTLICPYSKSQYVQSDFPYRILTENDSIVWVKGKRVGTDADLYVPAFLVYLPHNTQADGGYEFCQQTSTGVAAGRSVEEAVLSGISECIERHDFARFWYRQEHYLNSVPCLDAAFLLEQFGHNSRLVRLLLNDRVTIRVFDLGGLSCMETMIAFLLFPYKGRVMMSMGAATRFTKEAAVLKAVLEAYQGVEYSIQLDKQEQHWTSHKPDFSDVDSFHRHFAFYNRFPQYRNQIPLFNRFFGGQPDNVLAEPSAPKVQRIDDWQSNGFPDAVWVDLTTPDVSAIGYHVVRVVVPGLAYLTGSHPIPFLGTSELTNRTDLFTAFPHSFP